MSSRSGATKATTKSPKRPGTSPKYTEESARVIRAELQRRGLPEPRVDAVPIPDEEIRCVFIASGLEGANQIVAFLEAGGIASALRGESTTKTHGFTVDGLGKLEVLVRDSDEKQARPFWHPPLRANFSSARMRMSGHERANAPAI